MEQLDRIYKEMPIEKIPWDIESPPRALVEMVEHEMVRPCKTVDLGCGTGNYAIYLAGQGFDVTGIDVSPTAITIAQKRAEEKGVHCTFLVADVLGNLEELSGSFAFAYDWELLHHLFPEQRITYVRNVHRLLAPNGKYLSVCFSEQDPQFGGSGKYRKTPIDTVLYFSSESELKELFTPYFSIIDLKTIEIQGKTGNHVANYVLMENKEND